MPFHTSIAYGGSIGKFKVTPHKSRKCGVIIAKTDEDVAEIKSMAAFEQGRIWEATPEMEAKLMAPPQTAPESKAGYSTLFSLFTEEQNLAISKLPQEALDTIKENILQVLGNEFPETVKTEEKKTNTAGNEAQDKVSFAHLKELYKNKKNFNKWVANNGLEELWSTYKKAEDVDGFIAKLEEENN